MARAFAITAANTTIRLDSKGNGEVSYTVTNSSKHSLRGRARVVVKDSTNESWLSIAGEVERDFPPDATQQFTLRVQVPQGTPAGTYKCAISVASIENPDEEYAESPVVAFDVNPSGTPPKPFPWWIIIVIVAVLLVAGILIFLLTRPKGFVIPAVVNLTEAQAKQRLEQLCDPAPCLTVRLVPQASETIDKGKAIGTNPPEGSTAKRNEEVELFISAGRGAVVLTPVSGMKEAVARQAIEALCEPQPCVKVQVLREASDELDNGEAIRTEPAAKSTVEKGGTVRLIVSEVVAGGSLAVLPQFTADLDDATVKVPSSFADIWFDVNGGSLKPGFAKAKFVRIGSTPAHPKACFDESSDIGPIPLSKLTPGTWVCVNTTEGRVSEFRVIAASNIELRIDFKTWNRPTKFGIAAPFATMKRPTALLEK